MKTLSEIYAGHPGSDKGLVHSYIEFYDLVLAPWRMWARRVLEVGLYNGDSLRMWEEYFAGAEVWGIDRCYQPDKLTDLRPMIDEGTHNIAILDATKRDAVEAVFCEMKFDVIIEDASHRLEDQLAIYTNFRWLLQKPGLYIIEDVQDLDRDGPRLRAIDAQRKVWIYDRRAMKRRYDDVLVIIKNE